MEQHPNARLAPRGRETLVSRIESGLGVAEAARQMGVSRQTASKWLRRSRSGEPMSDRSSRPRRLARSTPREVENPGIDGLLEAFDIRRSLSRKGDPRDNAVIEPANRIPKKKLAYRRASADLGRLRREPNPCVRWRSEARTHSARGYMSPVEFRNAGLSL